VRVLVASTYVPFVRGGADLIVEDLTGALRERGHEVDTIRIPFHSDWKEMLEQMMAIRLMDVSSAADTLIAIRTPSYLLRHPNKRVWFIHHHRGAYDLWGTPYQDIPSTPEGLGVRQLIIDADNLYLKEAQRIYTNSVVVQSRLKSFNDIDSEVLYPPLGAHEAFKSGPAGDYVFYPSRIVGHKRQWLLVRAAAHLKTDTRIVIAGSPGSPTELLSLEQEIEDLGLRERVELIPRWISEDEKVDLMSKSLAVVYIPLWEDSYGYVTLEAFHSHKPIITCTDSGGTLEVIRDGVNGLIAEPSEESLAAAIDRLRSHPETAAAMGERAHETPELNDINWDRVITSLLA
jgi:glycosyltransferase involved in cell wall biosynthesis